MGRGERSFVRKRRRGCLTGCLTRLVLLLGVLAALFVGACVLGFVKTDETGRPSFSLENVGLGDLRLPDISLPSAGQAGFSLPRWAYGVAREGLTIKALRAGGGEAVLVCADGYTMLLGAGRNGLFTAAQLLLSGVTHLDAAVALSAEEGQIGGMPLVLRLMKPSYLILPAAQTATKPYNAMVSAAEGVAGLQQIVPQRGLTFSLGRSTVTFVGPVRSPHTDERNDGLSLRVDYGQTSALFLGSITATGEAELISAQTNLAADALFCARGGDAEGTSARLVEAVTPKYAVLTGKSPDNRARMRLMNAGADVCATAENGVVTLFSDGQTMVLER